MTWGLNANGHTDPANLEALKEIFNEAAAKAKELCPESFSCRYWDDNGQAALPVETAIEVVDDTAVSGASTIDVVGDTPSDETRADKEPAGT